MHGITTKLTLLGTVSVSSTNRVGTLWLTEILVSFNISTFFNTILDKFYFCNIFYKVYFLDYFLKLSICLFYFFQFIFQSFSFSCCLLPFFFIHLFLSSFFTLTFSLVDCVFCFFCFSNLLSTLSWLPPFCWKCFSLHHCL